MSGAPEDLLIQIGFIVLAAVFLSRALAAIFRSSFCIAESKKPVELSIVEKAFLVAGPVRAVEVALFACVRDGWARHDGQGFFLSRVSDAPASLSPFETEVLRALVSSKGMNIAGIRSLRPESSAAIEARLARKGLIFSDSEYKMFGLITIVPFAMALAIVALLTHKADAGSRHKLIAAVIVVLGFAIAAAKGMRRRTKAGDRLVEELRKIAGSRPRARRNPVSDTYHNPYDRLKDAEDDILFSGFASFAGTAFAPVASFAEDEKKVEDAFQWGTDHSGTGSDG